jgi:hypothetical protein
MIARLTGLLVSPRAAWDRIAADAPGAFGAIAGWLLPLALVPFGATLLRFTIFTAILGPGAGFAFAPYVLGDAALRYAFLVAWALVVIALVNALAPRFEASPTLSRASAVVAYALTPALLLSMFAAVPVLQYGAVAGLVWSVVLLRLGLPPLMRTPDRRATAYALTVAVLASLLALLVLLVPSCTPPPGDDGGTGEAGVLKPADGGAAAPGGKGRPTSSPDERLTGADRKGTGAINLDEFQGDSVREHIEKNVSADRMREVEEASRLAAETAGKIPFKPAEPSILGEFVPATACGLPRASLESKLARFPAGDMAEAQARFGESGNPTQVRMSIGDNTTAAAGMSQIRKLFPGKDRTTDHGYERFRSEGDRYFDERWDSRRREARFAVLIANRFVVSVVATGIESPGCAEAAARAVDWEKLAGLAVLPAR